MFGSKNTKGTTVVAREASFEGSLELAGSAHIEGAFKGALRAGAELSVGPEGSVEGTLTADTMVIAGRVRGTVVAQRHLHILASGKVEGQVFYQALQIDRGGVLAGEVRQGDRPAAEVADVAGEGEHDEQSGISPLAPRLTADHAANRTFDAAASR